jgi:SAM-dependent methyltransferase
LSTLTPPAPPPELLAGIGPGDFWAVGFNTVELVKRAGALTPKSRVLDVGCGLGRIAWPLSRELGTEGRYTGFDILDLYVAWCRDGLGLDPARFRFEHFAVANSHYRRDNPLSAETFTFPWPDHSFDLVIAMSVFTHLMPGPAAHYLAEIRRCLATGARFFGSFFIVDEGSLPVITAGTCYPTFDHTIPTGRLLDPENPDAAVAYNREWLDQAVGAAGFAGSELRPGTWRGPGKAAVDYYQDVLIAW